MAIRPLGVNCSSGRDSRVKIEIILWPGIKTCTTQNDQDGTRLIEMKMAIKPMRCDKQGSKSNKRRKLDFSRRETCPLSYLLIK